MTAKILLIDDDPDLLDLMSTAFIRGGFAVLTAMDGAIGTKLFEIHHPARVGEVLRDPDGGVWMRGRIVAADGASDGARGSDAWVASGPARSDEGTVSLAD